jgi:hypothetical protein
MYFVIEIRPNGTEAFIEGSWTRSRCGISLTGFSSRRRSTAARSATTFANAPGRRGLRPRRSFLRSSPPTPPHVPRHAASGQAFGREAPVSCLFLIATPYPIR